MESPWQFVTDAKSDTYCRMIVAAMIRLFGMAEEEAIGRINRSWGARGLSFLGEFDLIYHELPEDWANRLYWTDESFWWVTGEARESLGLGPPIPRPYP